MDVTHSTSIAWCIEAVLEVRPESQDYSHAPIA
jgi:hypothetical protein